MRRSESPSATSADWFLSLELGSLLGLPRGLNLGGFFAPTPSLSNTERRHVSGIEILAASVDHETKTVSETRLSETPEPLVRPAGPDPQWLVAPSGSLGGAASVLWFSRRGPSIRGT
jgi:hypothetical protein